MNLLILIINFIILYISSMFIHEGGHLLGALIQGVRSRIEVWSFGKVPSLVTYTYSSVRNNKLFLYSGGMAAGITYLILFLSVIDKIEIGYPLLSIGVSHIFYSIFEANYLEKLPIKIYMIIHYLIYITSYLLVWLLYKMII